MASNVPPFAELTDEDIERVRAELGLMAESVDVEVPAPEPPKRRRGRPRKSAPTPIVETDETVEPLPNPLPAVQTFSKRDEREVSDRLAQLLLSSTGMVGVATTKSYVSMTKDEAEAISRPLAAYLVRNEPTQKIARDILDNYDLLAIAVGVMAYIVRVYTDRSKEVAANRSKSAPRPIAERVSEHQAGNDQRPQVGTADLEHAWVSTISGNGSPI